MSDLNDLERAAKAFGVFSLDEQRRAVEAFARFKYPSAIDRFYEAVLEVIRESDAPSSPGVPQEPR